MLDLLYPPLDWRDWRDDWPLASCSRFVQAGGLRWHVQQQGRGPVMVLLHGTGASTHTWRDLMPVWTREFTVLSVDLPGHAFTGMADAALMTLPGMAQGLQALLQTLAIKPAVLVGHSAGAAVAAEMVLQTRSADKPLLVALNPAWLPMHGWAGWLFAPAAKLVTLNPLSGWLMAKQAMRGDLVQRVLADFHDGKVSIESAEGFIRQVIGWREFIRAVYEKVGVAQRTTNAMQHYRPLNWSHLSDLTLFKNVGQKLVQHAYAHHIERLMLLGNFFFLSETHPDEVYRFFMTYFIDAYDWVMVPNVYGMSQYADGGLMTTKPYFSGSNYLKKQGFKTDADGAALFDALFWHFVDKHQERLRKNMRTVQMVANWNRMLPEKKAAHLERAALYFETGQ